MICILCNGLPWSIMFNYNSFALRIMLLLLTLFPSNTWPQDCCGLWNRRAICGLWWRSLPNGGELLRRRSTRFWVNSVALHRNKAEIWYKLSWGRIDRASRRPLSNHSSACFRTESWNRPPWTWPESRTSAPWHESRLWSAKCLEGKLPCLSCLCQEAQLPSLCWQCQRWHRPPPTVARPSNWPECSDGRDLRSCGCPTKLPPIWDLPSRWPQPPVRAKDHYSRCRSCIRSRRCRSQVVPCMAWPQTLANKKWRLRCRATSTSWYRAPPIDLSPPLSGTKDRHLVLGKPRGTDVIAAELSISTHPT